MILCQPCIHLTFTRKTADDRIKLLISSSNGVKWSEAWQADQTGERTTDIRLRDEVNGAYEVLLKFVINGAASLDRLTVTTTTEHLAQRLGHAVEKAFGGEVEYHFSHENKVTRVSWQRE